MLTYTQIADFFLSTEITSFIQLKTSLITFADGYCLYKSFLSFIARTTRMRSNTDCLSVLLVYTSKTDGSIYSSERYSLTASSIMAFCRAY